MADTNAPLPPLPAHIEETIRLISQLRAEHHQNATPVQRALAPALGLRSGVPLKQRSRCSPRTGR
jgi:hypothetical protein